MLRLEDLIKLELQCLLPFFSSSRLGAAFNDKLVLASLGSQAFVTKRNVGKALWGRLLVGQSGTDTSKHANVAWG